MPLSSLIVIQRVARMYVLVYPVLSKAQFHFGHEQLFLDLLSLTVALYR